MPKSAFGIQRTGQWEFRELGVSPRATSALHALKCAHAHLVGGGKTRIYTPSELDNPRLIFETTEVQHMNELINFFALRPVFTHFGMKVLWYIYLLNAFVQAYIAVNGIFRILAQRGISWEAWSPNFIPLILGIIVQLALVRLFLEVAAIVLASHRS